MHNTDHHVTAVFGTITDVDQDKAEITFTESETGQIQIFKVIDNGSRPLRGLIDCKIWIDSNYLMFKSTRLGELVDDDRVRLR